jgi:cold shock CspA family protein
MPQGTIRQLIHLSAGTDVPATHLVPALKNVGYGYIDSVAGDVYFDYSAIKNCRFDQLTKGMIVDYVLDKAPYLRSSDMNIARREPVIPASARATR